MKRLGMARRPDRPIALAWCLIWSLLSGSLWPPAAPAFERYNKVVEYDGYFSKYGKRFFGPGFDWKYFKAQAVAESGLDPEARSRVGALGLMQIMPATFAEILHKNPLIKGGREQPRWNIAAGIYYNRQNWTIWRAERPFGDRINFMFGSFNAGRGNILKAQQVARGRGLDENRWQSIVESLPQVTGGHSRETIEYIDKIHHIKEVLR